MRRRTQPTNDWLALCVNCEDVERRNIRPSLNGIVQTYGYDEANELTSIAYTKGAAALGDLAYGYDGAGRRTAVWGSYARTGLPPSTSPTASYNVNNQLSSWNGTSLTYEPNGNLTSFGSFKSWLLVAEMK